MIVWEINGAGGLLRALSKWPVAGGEMRKEPLFGDSGMCELWKYFGETWEARRGSVLINDMCQYSYECEK